MKPAVVLAAILVSGRYAAASPSAEGAGAEDQTERARSLSDEGMVHFRNGAYDLAIEAFRKSYDLSPAPALLFDLGQAYRRKGDCAKAAAHFRRFAASDPGAARRADVGARIEEMETCAARGPAVTVKRGIASATAAGASAGTSESSARALPLLPAISPVAGGRPQNGEPDHGNRLRLAGFATIAAGVAALGVGIYATSQVIAERNQVTALFRSGGAWDPNWDERVARGRRYETVSKVMYGGGAAALGVGVALVYLGRPARSSSTVDAFISAGAVGLLWKKAYGSSF